MESKARDHKGIVYSLATDLHLKFVIRCTDKRRVLNIYFKFFQHCIEERKVRMEGKKAILSMATDLSSVIAAVQVGGKTVMSPSC